MRSLPEWLIELKKEIAAALAEDKDTPEGVRLEADRIIVSLQLETKPNGEGFSWTPAGGAQDRSSSGPHQLTIEFKVRPAGRSAAGSEPAVNDVEPSRIDPASAAEAKERLSAVFGPPGFDSSARATVFREALAGMTHAEALALVQSCRSGVFRSVPPLDHAHHVIARVLERSPNGVAKAAEAVQQVLETLDVAVLLRLVEEDWKTQDEWMDGVQA